MHKKVSIKASSTVVRIYSLSGEFLCEWPRATRKGQWSTNPEHSPDNYKGFTQWNGPYFIQKAQLIGKNTISVVADDLGEAGYRHSSPSKKELVRGGYVMPPEASSIDTLLSRSKALANQMREEADDGCLPELNS